MNKTSKLIAEICGVSRGTVDRALNNRPGISSATKEKILKTAEELGYKPHFLAQSLVKGRTMSIGAVVFDLNNRVFPQLINSIESRLREKGYFLYLTLTNKSRQSEQECIEHLTSRKVDGIILLSVQQGRNFSSYLENLGIPVVTFANQVSEKFPYIWIDDRQAIKDAVMHISSKQYEEIIFLSPPLALEGKTNLYAILQRYEGFKEAVEEAGIRPTVIFDKNYLQRLRSILEERPGRKAILCTSDVYAIDILTDFRDKGIRIPDDVGLMGFDNIDLLRYVTPGLATVGYSTNEMGSRIADSLIDLIHGVPVPSSRLLEHSIVEGETL